MITVIYTGAIIIMGLFTDMSDNKARLKYLIFSGIILVLISTLRSYYIGSGDTSRYADSVCRLSSLSYSQILTEVVKDPVYNVVAVFLYNLFGGNFQLVLCVFALVFVFSYENLVYRESPNLLISFIILFAMGFFSFSMHGIRQGLAMAFVMLSYFPLKNKKFLYFLFLVLVASCFHKSAIIFLVAYPFCRMGLNPITIFLYVALIIVFMFIGNTVLRIFLVDISAYDTRFSIYIDTDKTLSYAGLIQLCIFLIIVLANYKTYIAEDKDSSILLPLLFLAIIFQTFAIYIAEMFRVAMYFSVFLVVLFPRVLSTYRLEIRNKISAIVCVVLLAYFYSRYLEYDFFWNDGIIIY